MKHIAALTAAVAVLLTTPAFADTTYICMDDAVTGFEFKRGKFRSANYNEKIHEVRLSVGQETLTVTSPGSVERSYDCKPSYDPHVLFCSALSDAMIFNTKTLDYARSGLFGAVFYDEEDGDYRDSITVGVGSCRKL